MFSSGPTAAEKKLKQLAELLDRWELVTLTYQTSRKALCPKWSLGMFWWLVWLELYIRCEKFHGLYLIPTRWCTGRNWWTEQWNRIICFFPLKAELFGSFKSQRLKSYQIIWCVVRCLEARSSALISTQREAFRKHKKRDWKEFSLNTQHIIGRTNSVSMFPFFTKTC